VSGAAAPVGHNGAVQRPYRLLGVLAALACAVSLMTLSPAQATEAAARKGPAPAFAAKVPKDTTQVIRTVSTMRWCRQVWCTVTQAWRKDSEGRWDIVREFRSQIGARGWGKRRQGDERSPVGVFKVVTTFTTTQRVGTMPWRKRHRTSIIPGSGAHYNTWMDRGGRSGNRPAMRFGFVIDYNSFRLVPGKGPRPVPGKGFGIFYHTAAPGKALAPTDGCTQLGDPADMAWVLR
jgi:L,D-peptidoglycan transpeptidase YkuD (ErfK/YbiS/YcfS/YnhG family)